MGIEHASAAEMLSTVSRLNPCSNGMGIEQSPIQSITEIVPFLDISYDTSSQSLTPICPFFRKWSFFLMTNLRLFTPFLLTNC